ncbi:Motility protein B [compost metagenome]
MNQLKSISAILAVVLLASCGVSKKKYAELQGNFNQVQQQYNDINGKLVRTESELSNAKTRITSLDEAIARERANAQELQQALNKCLSASNQGSVNISKLVDEINTSNKYIKELIAAKNKSDSLNMVLTNNLTRSLSREEMGDVDIQVLKGVVYISLSDNMLYKSGSYEISDKSSATLGKIAKIITDYKDYEVLVEGNTDNVPIKMANIRNNWDLSALRASSVVQSLQNNYGVDPKRLTAGGRGEFNPIAGNDTAAGKTKNRRTQIIITPKLDQFMDLIGKSAEKPTN